MTERLDRLRAMRDMLDLEIMAELGPAAHHAIEQASDLYGVSTTDVLGRSQARQAVQARHASAWLMRREGRSLREIAAALGYADHMVVTYAIKKIDASPGVRALLTGLEVA